MLVFVAVAWRWSNWVGFVSTVAWLMVTGLFLSSVVAPSQSKAHEDEAADGIKRQCGANEALSIGTHGVSCGAMRPQGIIDVDGEHCEATSRDGYIAAGTQVTVVGVERGIPVVVSNAQETTRAESDRSRNTSHRRKVSDN